MAGVSRSATVVTSYIMWERSWNLYDSYELLRTARHRVRPEREFWNQLELFLRFQRNHTHADLPRIAPRWPWKPALIRWHKPAVIPDATVAHEARALDDSNHRSSDNLSLEQPPPAELGMDDAASHAPENPVEALLIESLHSHATHGTSATRPQATVEYLSHPLYDSMDWTVRWQHTAWHYFLYFYNTYLRYTINIQRDVS